MRGRYLDVIRSPDGVSRFPWRSNLVVDRCYPLLARLMRSETPLAGVAYLAVGRGGTGSGPSRSDVGLQDEIYRQRIAPGDLRFLDASGAPTPQPTSTLSIRAVIGGAELGAMPGVPQTLNEFGLFGGEATEDAGSGTLINRVVHDPHVLSVDAVLERRIELDFGETAAERSRVALTESMWVESGTVGSFGEFLPLRAIDGIGPNNRRAFLRAGLGTVDALARQDPLRPLPEFDPNEFRELVTKARLVRRLRVPRSSEALSGRRVLEVGATEPTELVSWSSGQLDLTSARTLQHALSVLEVALDRDAFEALTIGDLVAIPPMWTAPGERGPFGADLAVDAVQGVGKVLRERLIAAGRATQRLKTHWQHFCKHICYGIDKPSI
ncbi:MAG: helix-hairpin-helix domain-containing protein [Myxococcota bacterium]